MVNKISSTPSMDSDGLDYFKNAVGKSKCYLEYGSGGSTIYAANIAKVPSIISVESDKNWNKDVRASVDNPQSKIFIEHCDLGETGDWGTPKNKDRINDFWRYSFQPWDTAKKYLLVPDVVLVDGRFRVSAFLTSLLCSRVGTYLLFDDYFDRSEYFIVEEFCGLHEKHGRMGVFIKTSAYSQVEITRMIAKYSINWG